MIIITGVGRCGTSFVTKWLSELDYNVGSKKWFKPMNAGMENRQTGEINARLLKHYVKGEDVNLWHVRGDIEELPFDAVKSTDFLTDVNLIKEWAGVREIKVVWMHRAPEAIVKSVYALPEWNTPAYRTDVDMIERKVLEFEEALLELQLEADLFMFPDILDNPFPLIEFLEIEDVDGAVNTWNDLRDNRIRKG